MSGKASITDHWLPTTPAAIRALAGCCAEEYVDNDLPAYSGKAAAGV
jgi:hypothetical protein